MEMTMREMADFKLLGTLLKKYFCRIFDKNLTEIFNLTRKCDEIIEIIQRRAKD